MWIRSLCIMHMRVRVRVYVRVRIRECVRVHVRMRMRVHVRVRVGLCVRECARAPKGHIGASSQRTHQLPKGTLAGLTLEYFHMIHRIGRYVYMYV